MPLTRIKQKGQITLPAEVRDELGLEEGDYLEVAAEGGRVVLTPKVLLDRRGAWERIFQVLDIVRYVGPEPRPSPEEEERMVAEMIRDHRAEKRGQ